MSATSTSAESEPLVIHFSPVLKKMSEQEFYEFCQLNRDVRLELTSGLRDRDNNLQLKRSK